ncbi:MAG: hypothetical protein WC728_18250, partial [Elusimicrobiota bacterium]
MGTGPRVSGKNAFTEMLKSTGFMVGAGVGVAAVLAVLYVTSTDSSKPPAEESALSWEGSVAGSKDLASNNLMVSPMQRPPSAPAARKDAAGQPLPTAKERSGDVKTAEEEEDAREALKDKEIPGGPARGGGMPYAEGGAAGPGERQKAQFESMSGFDNTGFSQGGAGTSAGAVQQAGTGARAQDNRPYSGQAPNVRGGMARASGRAFSGHTGSPAGRAVSGFGGGSQIQGVIAPGGGGSIGAPAFGAAGAAGGA